MSVAYPGRDLVGGGGGGGRPTLMFRPNWGPKGRKFPFFLSQDVDDRPLPIWRSGPATAYRGLGQKKWSRSDCASTYHALSPFFSLFSCYYSIYSCCSFLSYLTFILLSFICNYIDCFGTEVYKSKIKSIKLLLLLHVLIIYSYLLFSFFIRNPSTRFL